MKASGAMILSNVSWISSMACVRGSERMGAETFMKNNSERIIE